MIGHTQAYATLREQSQNLFDFAVVVCYAVPSLKKEIKLAVADDGWLIPRPDYFENDTSSPANLRERAASYKPRLASYIVISSFSFLEAYVTNAIEEMIEFHGGKEAFSRTALRRSGAFLSIGEGKVLEHKRKLQEPAKDAKVAKYEKHTRELLARGYRFPTELFSPYGISNLYSRIRRLNADAIPTLLRDAFQLHLTKDQIARYHQIRDMRNRIAHGEPTNPALADAMQMNHDLRDLAIRVDQRLVEHFFILEEFA